MNCECRAAAVAVARRRMSDSWLRDRITPFHTACFAGHSIDSVGDQQE